MDKIFETNSGFYVEKRTEGKVEFCFSAIFANIEKIFILRGRLGSRS